MIILDIVGFKLNLFFIILLSIYVYFNGLLI